eukprot:6399031-Prymnesium_polylepis.1
MCIGEEREVDVPPALGFGARGSRIFEVPPGAALSYQLRMVSINGQTDPAVRRSELPDEQSIERMTAGSLASQTWGIFPAQA